MTTSVMQSSRTPLLVDFALQGGGAHGAFTWGVLDRLLEEPWLRIRAGDAFLRAHHQDLGLRSTFDLDALLEGV